MKRFWTEATIDAEGDGWCVLLDGKPVRVPGGGPLLLPTGPLAEAVAAEWRAAGGGAGGEMSYADLPLTRLAGTAQERILADVELVVLEIARYGETDLLCYRVEEPAAWAERELGARLRVTSTIIHVPQPPASLAALAAQVATYGHLELAALGVAVPALGSLVLGLAMANFRLTGPEAHALSTLEERYQAESWGWDGEAAARFRRVGEDLAVAGRFLALART